MTSSDEEGGRAERIRPQASLEGCASRGLGITLRGRRRACQFISVVSRSRLCRLRRSGRVANGLRYSHGDRNGVSGRSRVLCGLR
eukprot:813968-Pleurochrysis_carterae.AAC.1